MTRIAENLREASLRPGDVEERHGSISSITTVAAAERRCRARTTLCRRKSTHRCQSRAAWAKHKHFCRCVSRASGTELQGTGRRRRCGGCCRCCQCRGGGRADMCTANAHIGTCSAAAGNTELEEGGLTSRTTPIIMITDHGPYGVVGAVDGRRRELRCGFRSAGRNSLTEGSRREDNVKTVCASCRRRSSRLLSKTATVQPHCKGGLKINEAARNAAVAASQACTRHKDLDAKRPSCACVAQHESRIANHRSR